MTAGTLAGPLAFVILSGIMCWHLATVRGKWPVKLVFIVLVPSFGLLLWSGIASFLGHPTSDPLPERALLTGVDIKEPSAEGASDGAIYVMVVSLDKDMDSPLLGYRPVRGEPRLHVLRYTRRRHEMFEAAKARMADGYPVVLERVKKRGEEGRETEIGTGFSQQDSELMLYDLPPPTLPRKNAR